MIAIALGVRTRIKTGKYGTSSAVRLTAGGWGRGTAVFCSWVAESI